MKGFVYLVECGARKALLPKESGQLGSVLPRGGMCVPASLELVREVVGGERAGVVVSENGLHRGLTREGMAWVVWGWIVMESGEKVRVWCGRWLDEKVGPGDLERDVMLEGLGVRLEDGERWVVPRVMCRTGRSALPQVHGFADGEAVSVPQRRYAELEGWGRKALELLDLGEKAGVREVTELALKGLGVNYRVGGAEVLLLEVLSVPAALAILSAMVDVDLMARLEEVAEKKKGGDSG